MKPDKHGFDEMQKAHRDRIGSQTLNMLIYLILIDITLYGLGIRWLSYPTNIMVLLMASLSVYLIRIIAGNALEPAKSNNSRKTSLLFALGIAATIIVSAGMIFLFKHLNISFVNDEPGDHSALILFIISAAGLIAASVAAIVKKISDNKHGEKD